MAAIPDKINNIIRSYLNVDQEQYSGQRSYSFRQLRHRNLSGMERDIALVSDIFIGNRMDDKDKIRDITLLVSNEIEVLPFAPADFAPQNHFLKEILTAGIRLI